MPNEMTDTQVEREITRLLASPYVKLAMREEEIRLHRRQYMYQLRSLEKKGRKLEAEGITLEMLDDMFGSYDPDY